MAHVVVAFENYVPDILKPPVEGEANAAPPQVFHFRCGIKFHLAPQAIAIGDRRSVRVACYIETIPRGLLVVVCAPVAHLNVHNAWLGHDVNTVKVVVVVPVLTPSPEPGAHPVASTCIPSVV